MLGSRAAWTLPGGDGTGQVNLLGEAFRTKVRENPASEGCLRRDTALSGDV